ncbi:hypothetical protein Plec18167_008809 [Paecilomyces lecythidis]|uniref:Uncharacterized protein n=1 Tax=Paecilomyces lecythidis TaxID=3004212 RepID=A0ABR3WTL0_9EURO
MSAPWKSHKASKSSSSDGSRASGSSKDIKHNVQSKANPVMALNEEQPAALAFEKSTLRSLSQMQHVDANGNPITEPDVSNPTRYRYERPLDTIRSFERAIRRTNRG